MTCTPAKTSGVVLMYIKARFWPRTYAGCGKAAPVASLSFSFLPTLPGFSAAGLFLQCEVVIMRTLIALYFWQSWLPRSIEESALAAPPTNTASWRTRMSGLIGKLSTKVRSTCVILPTVVASSSCQGEFIDIIARARHAEEPRRTLYGLFV
jgi:hypothetical protein